MSPQSSQSDTEPPPKTPNRDNTFMVPETSFDSVLKFVQEHASEKEKKVIHRLTGPVLTTDEKEVQATMKVSSSGTQTNNTQVTLTPGGMEIDFPRGRLTLEGPVDLHTG